MNEENSWVQKLDECKAFILEHGMRPRRSSTDEDEKRMCHWLSNQLRDRKSGKLSNTEDARLFGELLCDPSFAHFFVDPTDRWEQDWMQNLDKLTQFFSEHDRIPSAYSPDNENSIAHSRQVEGEKSLAVWLNAQQTARSSGKWNKLAKPEMFEALVADPRYSKFFDTRKRRRKENEGLASVPQEELCAAPNCTLRHNKNSTFCGKHTDLPAFRLKVAAMGKKCCYNASRTSCRAILELSDKVKCAECRQKDKDALAANNKLMRERLELLISK